MTNEYSYEKNSCSQYLKELCALYRDRGVSAHVNEDALEQERNEAKTRNIAPNAYHMSYMMDSAMGAQFRNGSYNGQKYMTSDDFVAYFNKSRRYQVSASDAAQRIKPLAVDPQKATAPARSAQTKAAGRVSAQRAMSGNTSRSTAPAERRARPVAVPPAARQRTTAPLAHSTEQIRVWNNGKHAPVGNGGTVSSARRRDAKEVVAKTERGGLSEKVGAFASKWFPMELRENRDTTERRRFPLPALATIAAASISLMLIVGSNVMVSRASSELGRLKEEESKLRDTQAELVDVLEEKNDPALIRDLAVNEYGMVNRDYIRVTYVDHGAEDEVIRYGGETADIGISALLSAIGAGH